LRERYRERNKWRKDDEEYARNYWMTFRKTADIGN
jgi:hypothetical protein